MNVLTLTFNCEDSESKRKCDGVFGRQEIICVSLHSADGETAHSSDLQGIGVVPNTAWTFTHTAVLWQAVHR